MTPSIRHIEYKAWEKIVYFFPVQLLFVHLKKNLMLLVFWLLLFGFVTKSLILKYGVPYLFLYPEYMGEVGFWSHFIIGLAMGGFIMAFNLSSYVVNGFRFPFLATLNKPFFKYCINNVILPLSFAITYIVSLVRFQLEYENVATIDVLINVSGFLIGNASFILFTLLYFILTNRNTSHYLLQKKKNEGKINPVQDLFSRREKWRKLDSKTGREWKVVSYLSTWGRPTLARDSSHYQRSTLEKVFSQNRINASLFQITIIGALLLLSFFQDTALLMIPAAASVMLFFTILIMLTSAFYSWFRGWTSIAILVLFVVLNALSLSGVFNINSHAVGIDYSTDRTIYNHESIRTLQENNQLYKEDITNGLRYLENWKARTGEKKPVAVIFNVPGGGLRSAIWTLLSLETANDSSGGALWDHCVLISGSSGGMLGAAYLREFNYRKEKEPLSLTLDSLIEDISRDKLNPVAATAVLNDMFFRFRKVELSGNKYTLDRGHAFEQKFDQDTRGWLNRSLEEYSALEFYAEMPMMVLAPTISDDGRKLLIASQGVSYLAHNTSDLQLNENVEFNRFFKNHEPYQLSFISALRMSATFPYVFPATTLPTQPSIEVMDAGIRDNFGIGNTLKFMYSFRNWLAENTERVVIIQVRDQQKFNDLKQNEHRSLWESITAPFSTFYNTVLDVQDYQMEDQIRLAYEWYDGDIEVKEFILERSENSPISLSWHLTGKEQDRISQSIGSDHNQRVIKEMAEMLSSEIKEQ